MSAEDRNRRDAEELLQWLAEIEEEETEVPAGDRLAAYREGRLMPGEAAEIEALLGGNREARERLVALSGVRLPEPSRATRDAVLAEFASSGKSDGHTAQTAPRSKRSGRRGAGWLAAAAALAALAFGTWRLSDRWADRLDSAGVPEYRATIAGLADERAAPVSGSVARVLPETTVRIEAAPREAAVQGIELALYRSGGPGLERIAEERLRRLPAGRGAIAIEARAADLVGSVPGRYVLFLVVAPRGELPPTVELVRGETPQTALSGRRVIPLDIELLAAP